METPSDKPTNPAFVEAKARIDARVAELRRQVTEGPPEPPRPVKVRRHRIADVVVLAGVLYIPLLIAADTLIPGNLLNLIPRAYEPFVFATMVIATAIAIFGSGTLARARGQRRWYVATAFGLVYTALLWLLWSLRDVHSWC